MPKRVKKSCSKQGIKLNNSNAKLVPRTTWGLLNPFWFFSPA